MSLLVAPIMVDDADDALADARDAHGAGADMIEWRVDQLMQTAVEGGLDPDNAFSRIARLVRESPAPCVVTCRAELEGGVFAGDHSLLVQLLERLASTDHPPRYVDVEFETWRRSPSIQAAARPSGAEPPFGLIFSLHDFDGRPADLLRRLADMRAAPADVLKLAWRARSLRDNLEIFDVLRTRDRPTIALGMGEFGLMSRVLAPKFGGFLTFASLRDQAASAPGQPTIRELLETYRFRALGATTRVFGVIGWPVGHSLSPALHNAGFDAVGFDGAYLPLPVPTEWEHLKATLGALADDPTLDFTGGSVTIPHKEHLVRFALERADEGWTVDELSQACGAANTLTRSGGAWSVVNTDGPAAVDCLRARLGDDLAGRRIAILGAGGAAAAAAAALARAGARVALHNRTPERAQRLAQRLAASLGPGAGEIAAAPWEQRDASAVDAAINCTPIGMRGGPAPQDSPLDGASLDAMRDDALVFDTVYNPLETPLLRAARARGVRTIDGAEMFVRQAAAQFALWTGQPAPTEIFERIVRERLEGDAAS